MLLDVKLSSPAAFSPAREEVGGPSLKYALLFMLLALAFLYLAGNFELAVLGIFSDVSSRLTI